VIWQIMLPKEGACSDKDAHLGMVLLEKLSAYPYSAQNVDLQAVVAGRAEMEHEGSATQLSMCNRIRANIQAHLQ